jgi:hypothetical protein
MSYFCFGSHNEVSLGEEATLFCRPYCVGHYCVLLSFQFLQLSNVSGILSSGYIVHVSKSRLYSTFVLFFVDKDIMEKEGRPKERNNERNEQM